LLKNLVDWKCLPIFVEQKFFEISAKKVKTLKINYLPLNLEIMKKVIRVTENELGALLMETKAVNGMNMIASVLQCTQPKMLVKSRVNKDIKNTFGNVAKVSKVQILLNGEYETYVLNQLKREEKEESEYEKGKNTMPLEFGLNNRFIGKFNGKFVLQYKPNQGDKAVPRTKYLADGKIINKSKLVNFLPTETHATNQGTEKEILWRKLYLSNVVKLAFNGNVYKIIR